MVNITNLFAGLMTLIVSWGLIYMFHPVFLEFATGMMAELQIFALMIVLGFEMLIGLGLPYLMVVSGNQDNP